MFNLWSNLGFSLVVCPQLLQNSSDFEYFSYFRQFLWSIIRFNSGRYKTIKCLKCIHLCVHRHKLLKYVIKFKTLNILCLYNALRIWSVSKNKYVNKDSVIYQIWRIDKCIQIIQRVYAKLFKVGQGAIAVAVRYFEWLPLSYKDSHVYQRYPRNLCRGHPDQRRW